VKVSVDENANLLEDYSGALGIDLGKVTASLGY
jgi:hypothetical protein